MHEPDSWTSVGAKREQQMKSGNVDADVAGGRWRAFMCVTADSIMR